MDLAGYSEEIRVAMAKPHNVRPQQPGHIHDRLLNLHMNIAMSDHNTVALLLVKQLANLRIIKPLYKTVAARPLAATLLAIHPIILVTLNQLILTAGYHPIKARAQLTAVTQATQAKATAIARLMA